MARIWWGWVGNGFGIAACIAFYACRIADQPATNAGEVAYTVFVTACCWGFIRLCFFDTSPRYGSIRLRDQTNVTYFKAANHCSFGIALCAFAALAMAGAAVNSRAPAMVDLLCLIAAVVLGFRPLVLGTHWLVALRRDEAADAHTRTMRQREEAAALAQTPHGSQRFATADDLRRAGHAFDEWNREP